MVSLQNCSQPQWAALLLAAIILVSFASASPRSRKQEFTNPNARPDGAGGNQNEDTAALSHNCPATVSGSTLSFTNCLNLSTDGAFRLAWNVDPTTDVATVYYEGVPDEPGGWVAWGISGGGGMPDSNVIVAYVDAGTGPQTSLYYLPGFRTERLPMPESARLSYDPSSLVVEATNEGYVIKILARCTGLVGAGPVFVIWRGGPLVGQLSGQLARHSDLAHANRIVDFSAGTAVEGEIDGDNMSTKITHAWLVTIGYGVLMPIGILIARYTKGWLGKKWFYVHMGTQILSYILGLAGWSYGIWLSQQMVMGIYYGPPDHVTHFNMGIAIFCISTVQIFSPALKPERGTPVRFYWNLVHWFLGYITVLLATINIFFGFNLLAEDMGQQTAWKAAYISFLVVWVLTFLGLETLTWVNYLREGPDIAYERQESSRSAFEPGP